MNINELISTSEFNTLPDHQKSKYIYILEVIYEH